MKNFSLPMYNSETWQYINRIIKKYTPKCIILYGSLARKDYNERSDVDLVIISDLLPSNPLERLAQLMDLNDTFAPIEPLAYTSEEFELMLEKRHATALFALNDGIPLIGLEHFSQLKNKFHQIVQKHGLKLIESAWIITS
ncbi:MAG: nucleotidyltransferase domain-containing protein [Promethearchaeota archaeon]